MQSRYLLPALIVLSVSFTGCLDFILKFSVNPNGSARVVEDISIDKSLLEMFYSLKVDSSERAADSSTQSKPGKKKPFKWDQAKLDTVRNMLLGEELKKLRAKRFVTNSELSDTTTISGTHFLLTTDITSYRFVDSVFNVSSHDTTQHDIAKKRSSKKSKRAPRNAMIVEQGDSVMFRVLDDFKLDDEMLNALPGRYKSPIWKKTSYHLPVEVDTTDDEADSLAKSFKSLGAMMGRLITIEFDFQAPNILSYDTTAEFDSATNVLTWQLDLSRMLTDQEAGNRYVWFREPGSQDAEEPRRRR